MSLERYVAKVRAYKIARGRMKYYRDVARLLSEKLRQDIFGARLGTGAFTFDEDFPDEEVDAVDLAVWPTGEEISEGIELLKHARSELDDAWHFLSEDEQAAAIEPDDI